MSAITALLPIISILGFSNVLCEKGKIPAQFSIFVVTFLILLLQVFVALFGNLSISSAVLLATGSILFPMTLRSIDRDTRIVNACYFIVMSIALLLAAHTHLVVIDDYSYWGTLSKFLFLFHQLPKAPMLYAIDTSHLSYTPGLAAFHYLFYFAYGHYSVMCGYLAQNVLLFSCLIVVLRPRQLLVSLSQIALCLLILSFASGYVLGRMQADPILMAMVFSIIFILHSQYDFRKTLLILLPPILSLYWVKEIGFFLALFCLSSLFFSGRREFKLKRVLYLYVLSTVALLFFLKWIWTQHYLSAGFQTFAHNISISHVVNSINPFNANYQPAQWIMIKAIFFQGFDRILNLPYLIFYCLIVLMWRFLAKNTDLSKTRIIKNTFLVFLGIYLVLIYFLEALSFNVGHDFSHLLAFSRYYNILFTPFLLFISSVWLFHFEQKYLLIKPKQYYSTAGVLLSLCPTLILIGALQRFYFSDQKPSNAPLRNLAAKVKDTMGQNSKAMLCLRDSVTPLYKIADPLQFYLLPTALKLSANKDCAFVLVYADATTPSGYTLLREFTFDKKKAYLYSKI